MSFLRTPPSSTLTCRLSTIRSEPQSHCRTASWERGRTGPLPWTTTDMLPTNHNAPNIAVTSSFSRLSSNDGATLRSCTCQSCRCFPGVYRRVVSQYFQGQGQKVQEDQGSGVIALVVLNHMSVERCVVSTGELSLHVTSVMSSFFMLVAAEVDSLTSDALCFQLSEGKPTSV